MIVISLVLLGSVALAQSTTPQQPFLPFYHIKGQATGTDSMNRKVIFYVNNLDLRREVVGDGSGYYRMNVGELPYFEGLDLIFDGVTEYRVAVPREPGHTTGAEQVITLDQSKGFMTVDLALTEGGGPYLPPASYELEDIGRIRETNIIRVGNNLEITWAYDGGGPYEVSIYYYTGQGVEYSSAETYQLLASDIIPQEYVHSGVAVDGNNIYYRVVSDEVAVNDIFDPLNNSITVGKTHVDLPNLKYVFAALPFMEDNVSLAGILEEQVGEAGEFLWWDGVGYDGATYANASWKGKDRVLRMGEGFIIRAKADNKSMALVGRFGTLTSNMVRSLPADQYSLINYPYPIARTIAGTGVVAGNGDDLLRWDVDLQGYEGATYNNGSWVGPAGIDTLQLGDPRYYRPQSGADWTIVFP